MLEPRGLLDRALEFLPTDDEIEERRALRRGLTRPELAVLPELFEDRAVQRLVDSDMPEDPFLASELARYFPHEVADRFRPQLREHRLRREIIAMPIGGSMINRMGPFFVLRAEEETGADVAQFARAYAIVREVFGVRRLWREIESLDHNVEAKVQYHAIFQISRMVRRAVYWLLQNYPHQLEIEPVVTRFRPGVGDAFATLPSILASRRRGTLRGGAAWLEDAGLPPPVAQRIAALGSRRNRSTSSSSPASSAAPSRRWAGCTSRSGRSCVSTSCASNSRRCTSKAAGAPSRAQRCARPSLKSNARCCALCSPLAGHLVASDAALTAWLAKHHAETVARAAAHSTTC